MNAKNQLAKRPKNKPLLVMSHKHSCNNIKEGDVVGCYTTGKIEDSYFQVRISKVEGNTITGEPISVSPFGSEKDISFSIDYVHEIYNKDCQ